MQIKTESTLQSAVPINPGGRQLSYNDEKLLLELSAMRNSTCWRITWPLRIVAYIVRGHFDAVNSELAAVAKWLTPNLLLRLRRSGMARLRQRLITAGFYVNNSEGDAALAAIVSMRNAATESNPSSDPLSAQMPAEAPAVDMSIVTFNSSRWISDFVDSVIALDYPRSHMTLHFVDNGSTDHTVPRLFQAVEKLAQSGIVANVVQQKNRGFGAGHNRGIRSGKAPFCLVTNIDLTFEPGSLSRVVATALSDSNDSAAWELRQKPYEHPKYYDPVTGATNWNSHACVLIRRAAFDAIGGYDENIFMYGEDVEFSYRLRRDGWQLRYCPMAVVSHHAYEHVAQVKPLQYTGSTFANLYLRLKYGTWPEVLAAVPMSLWLIARPAPFTGARLAVAQNLAKLLVLAPAALAGRRKSSVHFPFRGWDYEVAREGAFVKVGPIPADTPLVTVVTRTCQGRHKLLRQAILSVAHQTYPNIEHIVVEDGGAQTRELVQSLAQTTGRQIRHIGLGKVGRSPAGNVGLAAAAGRWCLFLDDDDLLFSDHVEVLAEKLRSDPNAVAAYSLAWQVPTETNRTGVTDYIEVAREVPHYLRQQFDRDVLAHHNYMAIQSVLFERRLYIERGGLEEDFDALEDWILWQKYAVGNNFVFTEKLTSMYRTPADIVKQKRRDDIFQAAYPLALARIRATLGSALVPRIG